MHVALLMNFVAPYRIKLLEALRDRVGQLSVFISTPMERDRSWVPDWGSLNVTVQRNATFRRRKAHSAEFTRQLEIHIPYDTLPRLVALRPTAVISGELGARSFQAALYKLMRPSMPFLIWATLSEHSELHWGGARSMLRRFILRRADGVLVNGESGARYIARFGVPDERLFRVNQPVDVALFAGEKVERSPGAGRRILYSGLLIERKGVVRFADALNTWAKANSGQTVEMWWVGNGELHQTLADLARPPNVSYRFFGHVPYDQLPAVYAQADLFTLPSLMDEWGLVVNEAMASGLPVLGSIYSQAVEELVKDGVNGWVFDPRRSASMQAALDQALATPCAELMGMREAARQRIMALTPEAAADRMAQAILSVSAALQSGRRASGSPGRGDVRRSHVK